jgi:hypothetical protein
MIDRAQIEERLKNLTEQRELQRRRLLDYQAAVRGTEQACQQLEGAIVVLQDVLSGDKKEEPCPASPPDNGDSSARN